MPGSLRLIWAPAFAGTSGMGKTIPLEFILL